MGLKMSINQQLTKLSVCLVAACLAAASLPALAQSRTCVIDEQNGVLRCGQLADEWGYVISDRPAPAQVVPVYQNPRRVEPRVDPRFDPRVESRQAREEREQRALQEQERLRAQEAVNALYREVLGRDADFTSLRNFTDQVQNGRSLADLRVELATSVEARTAINQIYRDVLRREADQGGLNAHVSELRSGQSLSQIRAAIMASPEARGRR